MMLKIEWQKLVKKNPQSALPAKLLRSVLHYDDEVRLIPYRWTYPTIEESVSKVEILPTAVE